MCLAILKPANQIIPEDYLEEGFDSNPHGAGFMFARNNKLHIRKGFFTFAEFAEAYDKLVKPEDVAAVHFRLATHGQINKRNCHPFKISDDIGLIHNGIIPGFGLHHLSDTGHYTEQFLAPIFAMFDPAKIDIRSNAFRYLIYSSSAGNKIVILKSDGVYSICGERGGHWIKGVWYSNTCMLFSARNFRNVEDLDETNLGLPEAPGDEEENAEQVDGEAEEHYAG